MMDSPFFIVILASGLCGLVTGYVMHRADFCVTATFRDLFLFRDYFLIRMLVLLVVASMLLFQFGHFAGWLKPYPFPLLGPPALTTLAGGFLFGCGMVLAGGCVCGTLYKLGSGSLVAGVAFVGLIAGATLYGEFHPWWAGLAKQSRVAEAITLPQLLHQPPPVVILPLALFGTLLLLGWWKRGLLVRRSYATGHLQPWKAALILAGVGFASWFFVGMPMGITTSYSKIGATIESWVAPEHVKNLAYFQAMPLNYTPPFATTTVKGGAGPALDAIAALQYPLLLGILLGAAFSAWRTGDLRLHKRMPGRQFVSALAGGLIVGLAARMTPACNLWHLWGGLPVLALQSLFFLAALLPGAWLGSRILAKWVIR